MVGIVIVCHSKALAQAIVELSQQMVQTPVPIAIAAGIDDPEHPFGTDPIAIQQAIESIYTDEGVIVLMDLGSALLSAEMALEFLPADQREKVKLTSAPLVEGAIAAIVQASTGANCDQILSEATTALNSKISQLSPINSEIEEKSVTSSSYSESQTIDLTVKNSLGIHARPAAQFVAIANQFEAQITLENLTTQSQPVNGKSINQVITLGVRQNHHIRIFAQGEDATLALNALQELIEGDFGETTPDSPDTKINPQKNQTSNADLIGIPASEGMAVGSVISYRLSLPQVDRQQGENPQREWQQLQRAIATAKHQINEIIQSAPNSDIFQAHLLYLQDPTLLHQVHHRIFNLGESAAWGWKTVIEETINTYQTLNDPYLQGRGMDVLDVGGRVLRILTGGISSINLTQTGIIIAQDLTPSEVAHFNPKQVLGICTVGGSPTAHSALIANMLGIPMIVNVGIQLLELPPETEIAIDGKTGEIWLNNPDKNNFFLSLNPPLLEIKKPLLKMVILFLWLLIF